MIVTSQFVHLKVLINEKRLKIGRLTVVSFDRSSFKLFSQKFSNKLVQVLSSERPKTAPRTLFLYYMQTIIIFQYRHSVGLRHIFLIIHLIRYCTRTSTPIFKRGRAAYNNMSKFTTFSTKEFLFI